VIAEFGFIEQYKEASCASFAVNIKNMKKLNIFYRDKIVNLFYQCIHLLVKKVKSFCVTYKKPVSPFHIE
jgi:hypothetical protein